MSTEAVKKIQTEMNANKNNQYVQVVGDFLLKHLEENEKDAEKVLVEDKSILKSLEAMRKDAEKKKVGNVAVLTPAEGFASVLKYYGIGGKPVIPADVLTPAPATQNDDFDVKLDDFL